MTKEQYKDALEAKQFDILIWGVAAAIALIALVFAIIGVVSVDENAAAYPFLRIGNIFCGIAAGWCAGQVIGNSADALEYRGQIRKIEAEEFVRNPQSEDYLHVKIKIKDGKVVKFKKYKK